MNQLIEITTTRTGTVEKVKELVEKLQNTFRDEDMWLLSRNIRLCSPESLKAQIENISRVTIHRRSDSLAAAFASAHLLRVADTVGQNDSYKWARSMKFPTNPEYASYIYNIVALPTYSNALPQLWQLLQCRSLHIQRHAAAGIARSAKSPMNFLKRVLATISKAPPSGVEKLEIPDPKHTLTRGLIIVAQCLSNNPVSASEYYNSLISTLSLIPSNAIETTTALEAQKLLSTVMDMNPSAFHRFSMYDSALIQAKSGNLHPSYLSSILKVFGISCIRKMVSHVFTDWVFSIRTTGLKYLEVVAPYAMFLSQELQLIAQKEILAQLEAKPFNKGIQRVLIMYLMSSSPSLSSYISSTVLQNKYKNFSTENMCLLKQILEPKMPPLLHPMRTSMKIPEIVKKDAFSQVNPQYKSIIVQCDGPKTSVPVQPKRIEPIIRPLQNTVEMSVDIIKEPVQHMKDNEIELDSDIELDLDAKPDSDDE